MAAPFAFVVASCVAGVTDCEDHGPPRLFIFGVFALLIVVIVVSNRANRSRRF